MSPTPHDVGGAHLPRRGAPSCFLTRRLVYGGRPALDEAERLKTSAFRDMRNRGALLRAIPFTLAIGIIAAGLTISAAKAAGESYDPAAVTSALCRGTPPRNTPCPSTRCMLSACMREAILCPASRRRPIRPVIRANCQDRVRSAAVIRLAVGNCRTLIFQLMYQGVVHI